MKKKELRERLRGPEPLSLWGLGAVRPLLLEEGTWFPVQMGTKWDTPATLGWPSERSVSTLLTLWEARAEWAAWAASCEDTAILARLEDLRRTAAEVLADDRSATIEGRESGLLSRDVAALRKLARA